VFFGNPETTTGGTALKFYCSVRIEVRRIGQLKLGDKIIGNRTKAKVVKNKVAAPFRQAEFDILYNQGISREGDALDTAITYNVLAKIGNTVSYGELKFGVGRQACVDYLKMHPEVVTDIREKTLLTAKERGAEEMESGGRAVPSGTTS
jgi:recombination protein RecA